MRSIKIGHPGFMEKLDHYLLVNHPVLWRTRGHYFLFYSAILANLLLLIIPVFFIRTGSIPTEDDIAVIYSLVAMGMGFGVLYWAYTQFKYKFKSTHFKDILATILVYILAVGSLFSNLFILNASILGRTANVVSDKEFYEDKNFVSQYQYFNGFGQDFNMKFEFLHDRYTRTEVEWGMDFSLILKKYGIHVPPKGRVLSYEDSRLLKSKIKSVDEAKIYFTSPLKKAGRYYSVHHDNMNVYSKLFLSAAIMVPAILFLFSVSGIFQIFLTFFLEFLLVLSTGLFTSLAIAPDFRLVVSNLSIIALVMALALLVVNKPGQFWRITAKVFFLLIPFTLWFSLLETFNLNESIVPMLGGTLASLLLVSFGALILKRIYIMPQDK